MNIMDINAIINTFDLTPWGKSEDFPNYAVETEHDYIRAGVYYDDYNMCYKPYLKLKSGKDQQLKWLESQAGWTWKELKMIASGLTSAINCDARCLTLEFDELDHEKHPASFNYFFSKVNVIVVPVDSGMINDINTGTDGLFLIKK